MNPGPHAAIFEQLMTLVAAHLLLAPEHIYQDSSGTGYARSFHDVYSTGLVGEIISTQRIAPNVQ